MKIIKLRLEDNKALVVDTNAIFLEQNESVAIVIENELLPGDELYYSLDGKLHKIEQSKSFVVGYNEIINNMKLTITHKSKSSLYPMIYTLDGFKVNGIKVIGETFDERYPAVIEMLYDSNDELKKEHMKLQDEYKTLSKAFLELNEKVDRLEKIGKWW